MQVNRNGADEGWRAERRTQRGLLGREMWRQGRRRVPDLLAKRGGNVLQSDLHGTGSDLLMTSIIVVGRQRDSGAFGPVVRGAVNPSVGATRFL